MSIQENQPAELEEAELEYYVVMGEALNRLEQNPDFKQVILHGYFQNKALDSVSMLGVESVKKAGERTHVMEDLVSISNLQQFFIMIKNFHRGAVNPVLSDEEQAELDRLDNGIPDKELH